MIGLDSILDGVSTAGICGHVKPDGDAYGSCMGLYLFLKTYYPHIRARVYLEDNYPESFRFVSCSEEIIHDYPKEEAHDVFFALDCSDLMRLGQSLGYFQAAKKQVVIDHHISNSGFGMINEIQPDASSTSELIALLIGQDRITKQIAEPLYMGIVHDSGVFRYSCTSSRTMAVAGILMDTGIDFPTICDETFFLKSHHQNQILGKALMDSVLMMDGRLIYSVVRQSDLEFYHLGTKDLDGIVQQLRVTRGVEVALFLYEISPNEYKVSMRSNGHVDVARIGLHFSGGGHVRAAGCNMEGSLSDVIDSLVSQVEKQLPQAEGRRKESC